MAGKKLVNRVDQVVADSLAGYVALHPGVRLLQGFHVALRADLQDHASSHKVAVLAGGGSGHEPLIVGYVGQGMLTGGVHGAVFASPGPTPILAAIRALAKDNPAGVLVLVNNYTGDRLTFGQAVERAIGEGIKVEVVVNADDCAVIGRDKTAGRRGLCGYVLMMKIAGALAEEGKSLEEVSAIVKLAQDNLGSLGVSLSACSLPGRTQLFTVGPNDMEIGLGLHGERGVKTVKMMTAKETVETMLQIMTDPDNKACITLNKGDHVAVMVNNLGATSEMEMNIVSLEIISQLEQRCVLVDRAYSGRFATSLDMAGISLTILKLQDILLHCLDAETSASGWIKPNLPRGTTCRVTPSPVKINVSENTGEGVVRNLVGSQTSEENASLIYSCLRSLCQSLIKSEEQLNVLDSGCGDGDCGTTMRTGAEVVLTRLGSFQTPGLPVSYPHDLLLSLAHISETYMGGTSGGLYNLFLTAAAGGVKTQTCARSWLQAIQAGVDAIKKYGGAEPGDRTMLDPLHTAAETLKSQLAQGKSPKEALRNATEAAEKSAQSTAKMVPRAGRATYVSADHLGQPDPGAIAVAHWMKAISDCCNSSSE